MFVIRPMVEFCVSNLANGSQKVYERLERDGDCDVLDYGCLGYCGKCSSELFAMVNGELVTADSPDELYNNIQKKIDEQL
ncbi:MAG: YuzB family protein [Bacilli bacterium]